MFFVTTGQIPIAGNSCAYFTSLKIGSLGIKAKSLVTVAYCHADSSFPIPTDLEKGNLDITKFSV